MSTLEKTDSSGQRTDQAPAPAGDQGGGDKAGRKEREGLPSAEGDSSRKFESGTSLGSGGTTGGGDIGGGGTGDGWDVSGQKQGEKAHAWEQEQLSLSRARNAEMDEDKAKLLAQARKGERSA